MSALVVHVRDCLEEKKNNAKTSTNSTPNSYSYLQILS